LVEWPASLSLKIHWVSNHSSVDHTNYVTIELHDGCGLAVASVSVPRDRLLQEVSKKLECQTLLSPDGFVSASSGECAPDLPKVQAIALDQLVANTISPDMLDDEPTATLMLSELRARLLKSLKLVDEAIALSSKP
jgi:hypothetical protein